MLKRLAPWLALAALAPGCSLIFKTDDLPERMDGQIDGPPGIDASIDAMLPDSNPLNLNLRDPRPAILDEAAGSDGGRPTLLLIDADNVVASATISVGWEDMGPEPIIVDAQAVSPSLQLIAVALRIPELPTLNEMQSRNLKITVMQDPGVVDDLVIPVAGHDPLIVPGTLDTNTVNYENQTFSSITIGNVTASGDKPLQLHAIGTIRLNGTLDASAVGEAVMGRAGPGGCVGGDKTADAPCQPAGGATPPGGLFGAGGGGGGYGTGGGGAEGGDVFGNAMLVPLVAATGVAGNRGHGGGGGAASNLGLGGGAGGNGGGVVALVTEGTLRVGTTGPGGRVFANGSPGVTGGVGGAGGSGSGGAILIRAGAIADGTGMWLTADGAAPAGNGGLGGFGRIRIDTAGPIPGAPSPTPAIGPTWMDDAPLIVRGSQTVQINIRAASGCYAFTQGHLAPAPADPCAANPIDRSIGMTSTPVSFILDNIGHNSLCAAWGTMAIATDLGRPEALSCLDVIYIP